MTIDKYLLAFILASLPVHAAQQKPPARDLAQRPVAAGNEATELANGWQLLAQGRTADAATLAARMIATNPRSGAVLGLALEAAIRASGAAAGLAAYEKWLGQRSLEEPAAVRRIAEAILDEATASSSDAAVRATALHALA
ncbi:MAG: hypothetical protein H0W08_19400, partial [Acidobacteria bacterium]|nr:hypothetical protein [Acidobacteriota bacterium]